VLCRKKSKSQLSFPLGAGLIMTLLVREVAKETGAKARQCSRGGGAGGAVIERNEDNGLFPSTFQATNPIFSSCQHLCIDRKEGEGPLL
jgi:hypothetical protein